MMRRLRVSGMIRVRLIVGAVDLAFSPSSFPPDFRRKACQRNTVRRETVNASLVASSPCFSQNARIRHLCFAWLVIIYRNRSISCHSDMKPLVPLNLLNMRISPRLLGVPYVSELMQFLRYYPRT